MNQMLNYVEYVKIFISFLAIINPFGAIPIFISMTADQGSSQLRKTLNTVAFGVVAILLVALFFGELVLEFFGITIASFRVGGGILILLMAIAMLHAKTSNIKQTDEEADEMVPDGLKPRPGSDGRHRWRFAGLVRALELFGGQSVTITGVYPAGHNHATTHNHPSRRLASASAR